MDKKKVKKEVKPVEKQGLNPNDFADYGDFMEAKRKLENKEK